MRYALALLERGREHPGPADGGEDVLEFEFGGNKFRSSVNVVTFAHRIEEF
ncbi:MAG: hypothetical protein ILM98_12445 [Kiritimatiellae bacterium]|nr:hypothetical protein [Kiritimatiellia bacterium]